MELHEKIKEQRKKMNFSQEDIAYELGWEQTKYSKIERGILNPSSEDIKKLEGLLFK